MISINESQFEQMQNDAGVRFSGKLKDHLRQRVPSYLDGLDEPSADTEIAALTARARAHGMRKSDHIRRYAVVSAAARRTHDRAEPDWFDEIASARSSAALKLIRLEESLLHLGRPSQGAA